MNNDCVCGFAPPLDPNPDCERCQQAVEIMNLEGVREQLLTEINRLEAMVEALEKERERVKDQKIRIRGILLEDV